MTTHRLLDRRMAIAEMGKAGLAIAILGTVACSEPGGTASTPSAGTAPSTAGAGSTTTVGETSTTTVAPSTTSVLPGADTSFQRVDLDFVSAYVLYRGGEAALVDTGVDGSAPAIEAALAEVGLGWETVAHLVITHKHPDHVGSVDAVLELAPAAAVYAGGADIPSITSAVQPQEVGDGDTVFDLEVISTPGHTPGHICVLDPAAGILVAGDAMVGADGGVGGPDPSFAEDIDLALESVRKLAGFDYEVALFGHGEPALEGASRAVAALAGA